MSRSVPQVKRVPELPQIVSKTGRLIAYYPSVSVFVGLALVTLILYKNTLWDLPKADHVQLFSIFEGLRLVPQDIGRILFGEVRTEDC